MNVIEIIDKKRLAKSLTKKEFEFIVNGYLTDKIPDYQMSAFLMAVTINGLTKNETILLTDVFVKSGEVLKFDFPLVDKHSTGGVGDKTTFLIAAIIAACGLKMVKMSGRGLGKTGGTIDKLSAIKGFKYQLSISEIKQSLNEVGVCLISQQANIAIADKKIYELRDVTATTNSIPLIASSIMSKKIASGAKNLVIDIKVGQGAFIKTKKAGYELADLMKAIGFKYGIKVTCVLTTMDYPLGKNIGNGLEIIECLEFLKGDCDEELKEIVITLAALLLIDAQKIDMKRAKKQVIAILDSQKALQKFNEIIENQGGNLNEIIVSNKKQIIPSPKAGYIKSIDAAKIAEVVKKLGGSRNSLAEEIDYGVGLVLHKNVGDYVKANDSLVTVFYNKKDVKIKDILACFEISQDSVNEKSTIIDIV